MKLAILLILFIFVIPTIIGTLIKRSVLNRISKEEQMPDPITMTSAGFWSSRYTTWIQGQGGCRKICDSWN